jgi:hypothetical protein
VGVVICSPCNFDHQKWGVAPSLHLELFVGENCQYIY